MASQSSLLPWGRRSGRRLLTTAAVLALAATPALTPSPAHADAAAAPRAGALSLHGAGFGHGRGMSQYGAYGAARSGLTWKQILGFYYPGTKPAAQSSRATIKVWITSDSDNDLRVVPAPGLRINGGGRRYVLPAGSSHTAWRVTRSGTGFRLSSRNRSGRWVTQRTPLSSTSTWWFERPAKAVKVWVRNGDRHELRGSVALVARGTGGRTVNRLPMEDYVRGVVPAEMPTSWSMAAVAAQAVAARTYATRLKAFGRHSGYDVCDTTSCQVYRGLAVTYGHRRTVYETLRGNAAVTKTARTILMYGRSVALTEFGSSNGGSTARGSFPYTVAKKDPYDGLVVSNDYRRSIAAASVQRLWPSVGTVRQVQITKRSGPGRWGGRVTALKIVGSKRTVTVAGGTFAARFGLRSTLYTLS